MCKLGFVSSKEKIDNTNYLITATTYYGSTNRDGFGYAFPTEKGFRYCKSAMPAPVAWLNSDVSKCKLPKANSLIFHNRIKTQGEISQKNSHPFLSEDGKWALVHNGGVWNWEKAKIKLTELGHKFESDVDSEILLHAWEQWKNSMMKELEKLNCTGWITMLIMNEDGTIYAYTDGTSLVFKNSEGKFEGMSTDDLLGSKDSFNAKKGILYTIKEGFIVKEDNIGELRSYTSYNRSYDFQESGWRRNHFRGQMGIRKGISSEWDVEDVLKCGHCNDELTGCDCKTCDKQFQKNQKIYCYDRFYKSADNKNWCWHYCKSCYSTIEKVKGDENQFHRCRAKNVKVHIIEEAADEDEKAMEVELEDEESKTINEMLKDDLKGCTEEQLKEIAEENELAMYHGG